MKLKMKELEEIQLVFSIWFKNLTSGTIVESRIQMTSFYQNGCHLVVPVRVCAKGHQVLLRVMLEKPKRKTSLPKMIEMTGTILELAAIDEKCNEINIQFSQYVKEEWQAFTEQFEIRQEEINSLIQKLKKIS